MSTGNFIYDEQKRTQQGAAQQQAAMQQEHLASLDAIKSKTYCTDAIRVFDTLDDQQFVDFIHWTRHERELWWGDSNWSDAIKMELSLRMLLKK